MIVLLGALLIGAAIALAVATSTRRARPHALDDIDFPNPAPKRRSLFTALRKRGNARKRLARFEEELPDSLDLLAGSLEAGSSLAQAIELVASEGRPPLSEEFARALSENALGRSLADSLSDVASRIGSRDFSWVVTGVRLHHEHGASLAGLLRTASRMLRERDELRREVRTLTAEGRISAWILTTLPFALAGFFMLSNPKYLASLLSVPLGWALLAVAGALLTGGIVWLRRIVKDEVI